MRGASRRRYDLRAHEVRLAREDLSDGDPEPRVIVDHERPHMLDNRGWGRPGHVDVSAALNGTKITTAVRVGGLVLSEVFYNPASSTPDQLQWIEIANQADVPLDLSTCRVTSRAKASLARSAR